MRSYCNVSINVAAQIHLDDIASFERFLRNSEKGPGKEQDISSETIKSNQSQVNANCKKVLDKAPSDTTDDHENSGSKAQASLHPMRKAHPSQRSSERDLA